MSPTPPDAPKVALADAVAEMATGDILIFHCDAFESRVIDLATDSWFSHAAMVVRNPTTDQVCLWQTDPGSIVRDVLTGKAHAGAQLGDLTAAVEETARTWGDQPYWRRLEWTRPSGFDETVGQALAHLDGTAYPGLLEMLVEYLLGRTDQPAGSPKMFCSQLIAATYLEIGLLETVHPDNFYAPKDFSSEAGATLPLVTGASLGAETELVLPTARG